MILYYGDLAIRDANPDDAGQLCAWWNDGKIMAHAGFPNGLSETPDTIRKSLAQDSDDRGRRHMIELGGKPIGEMNYRNKGSGTAEIGIKICDFAQQNKGYGTTLLTMFIDALFTYYGYEKIILDTNVKNRRAQHVYERKLGFRCLGTREHSWLDQLGEPQYSIDYELAKEDWETARTRFPYIRIRLETPDDYRQTEELTKAAFWKNTDRGVIVDEHLLVHRLRKLPVFIPELNYLAQIGGKIVGNVLYSKAKIVSPDGLEHPVLTFGPLSVLPEYQNRGVGKALMRFTIQEARRLKYSAIVICGEPDYYPRFGFRRAKEFGLTCGDGGVFDAFMAMELIEGALCGIGGRYYEDSVFHTMAADEVAEFDRDFPQMTPRPIVPVDALLSRLDSAAADAIRSLNLPCLGALRSRSQAEISSLPGIDDKAIQTIRTVMREHGRIWGEGGERL
ncbi:MAG: GNAT family N-acetyltransferase [Christensenellales bacterium]